MCQLHLIKKFKGNLDLDDMTQLNKFMLLGSQNNPNAFGLFNKNYFKAEGIFNERLYNPLEFLDSNFVVGHNRLSTGSGIFGVPDNSYINNHPFIIGELTLAHNGIINNAESIKKEHKIKTKIKTDSYVIIWLINYYLGKIKGADRITNVCNAISKAMSELNGGISIFLYDRISDRLYYYKNFATRFNMEIVDNKYLIGSTDYSNLEYFYSEFTNRKPVHIESNYVYIIGNENKPIEKYDKKVSSKNIEISLGFTDKIMIGIADAFVSDNLFLNSSTQKMKGGKRK